MAKHRLEDFEGKAHTSIITIGPMVTAARVHPNKVWAGILSMWQSERKR